MYFNKHTADFVLHNVDELKSKVDLNSETVFRSSLQTVSSNYFL